MTRKILVVMIALIYMILGLVNGYYSLVPILFSSGLIVINLFQLVGGALAFHAGLTMFRLDEFGRKLVIFWLYVRVFMNVLLFLWLPFKLTGGAGLGIQNYLGEITHRITIPYTYQGLLFVWTTLVLLIILFLSQKETKAIFAPEATKEIEPDIIFE